MSNIKPLRPISDGDTEIPGDDPFIAEGIAAIKAARADDGTKAILLYGQPQGGVGYISIRSNAWECEGLIEVGTRVFHEAQDGADGD
jgi:hypothetical protein